MSIGVRHTKEFGARFDVSVRLRGHSRYLGRYPTFRAAEACMGRFWAEEKAREHVSKLRRRKEKAVMAEIKKASAAMPIQASVIPPGAVMPKVQARQPHPMDALNEEGARLRANLHRLATEFHLAQPRASRIIRHEIGSEFWCRFHGCPGTLEVSGRRGVCTICKRNIDVFDTPGLVPRLRLPEVVVIPEGAAELERLQKAITRTEKEIEAWKKNKAAAELDLVQERWGNRPGPPSPYVHAWK
jgi:hypothetical protein